MLLASARPLPSMQAPNPRLSRLALPLVIGSLLIIVACLTAARFLVAPLDRFDEGVTLTKAWLLSQGELPYRDFWATYGPLDIGVLGVAFKLTTADVLLERLLAIGAAFAWMGASYVVLSVLGARGALRWLMTALLALVPLAIPAFNSAILADLAGVIAFFAFARSLRARGWRWTVVSGGVVALASLARPELAVAVGGGLLMGSAVIAVNERHWTRVVLLIVTVGICTSVLWLVVIVAVGVRPLVLDLVQYTLSLYAKARGIPLGQGPEGGAALVMAIAFGVIWLWAAVVLVRERPRGPDGAIMVSLLVAGVVLFTWVRTRADGAHALTAWPPTCLLLAVLMARRRRAPAHPPMEAVLSVLAILSVASADVGLVARDLARPAGAWQGVPRATLVGARSWLAPGELARLIADVDRSTAPSQPIFVGLHQNAQVVFNDTALYFLTGRRPGTTYFEFLPGFTNSRSVENVLVCQMEQSGVQLAILGPNTPGEPWNASAQTGSPFLDQWIGNHTVAAEDIGPYRIVHLRSDAPPRTCPDVTL